ncbi:hypothetical protein GCM10008013_42540 [Paenibacillus segetis]|uniref:Uncharacterized protein n=1 Tax=Paenibacillus segetis TaxID=1325360 RepID=A0ABQ1YTW4_9BACL|nr:hypothetical protein GCM10008013_42540 [Paenibacillus segetis]
MAAIVEQREIYGRIVQEKAVVEPFKFVFHNLLVVQDGTFLRLMQDTPDFRILFQEDQCLKRDTKLILERAVKIVQLLMALLTDFILDERFDFLVVVYVQRAEWK